MSFRTRLFVSYALIVFICLSLVAIAFSLVLQSYRDRLVMESLDNIARPIYVQVRSLVSGNVTTAELWSNLEEQARINNVYILLAGSKDEILRQITPGQTANPIPEDSLPKDIETATQGSFETSDGRTYLFAAYTYGRLSLSSETRISTIYVATPRSGSLVIWASLIRPLLFSGVIALVVSLVIAAILARSVYRPLKQVSGAAQRIARGEYDQKVPEDGPREYRELAANFNNMAEKVEQSQRQLRHFVADVSHELKSPITSIQGFAQALVDGTAGDEKTRQKAARIINDESRRLRRQVEELLELSRMQSGQLPMIREPVEIDELLERCRELFGIQAEERNITLEVKAESPATVTGDVDRLEQLFGNLLDNAIKNSHAGGRVRITAAATGDGNIAIGVSDSGPGIPPEQIPHVFERFYQVTGVRTGVGLGLAIAREIALAHHGTIEVLSEPGAGAEFMVRLPLAER
jgi:signal transduction histidine kinase